MSNSVGRIFVELGVNSAAFSEGLTKASYATQQFGKKTSHEFRSLGNSLAVMAGAFGAFGPAGAAVASAVSIAGQAAGNATAHFAKLGKSIGVLTGLTAGAVTAFASLAVAGFGMVIKTSDTMLHEMERQAQSAGTNITEFTRLAYMTRVLGVSQETLVKGLQRMNRSALMAAEGGKQQQEAFRMLIGTGREFQNIMHSGTVSIETLADGFNKLKDPQLRSALAMQVFSRQGAQLIPLFTGGSAAMRKFGAEADALGVTLTDKDVASAVRLTMNLTRLKEAFSGMAIRITNQLSPALANISDSMVNFAKNGAAMKSIAGAIGDVLLGTVKVIYEAAFAWEYWADKIDIARLKIERFAAKYHTIAQMIANVVLAPTGTTIQLNKGAGPGDIDKKIAGYKNDIEMQRLKLADLLATLTSTSTQPLPKMGANAGGTGSGNKVPSNTIKTPATDYLGTYMSKLEASAEKAKALANAIDETVGAQAMLNAQDEAANSIANEKTVIQERIKLLAKEITENANSYTVQQKAAHESEIAELKKQANGLETNRQKIVELYATIAGSKEAKSATQGLEAETGKYTAKIKALNRELAALAAGQPFHAQDAALAGDIEKVKELQDALAEAQKLYGQNSDAVRELVKALADANAELVKHREQLAQIEQKEKQIKAATDANNAAKRLAESIARRQIALEQQQVKTMSEGLAKAIVNGREDFRALGASIENSLIKTGITNVLTNFGNATKNIHKPGGFSGGLAPHGPGVMGVLGGLLGFGKTGKVPGTSETNAMWVRMAGGGALGKASPSNPLAGLGISNLMPKLPIPGGGAGGLGSIIGKLAGGLGGGAGAKGGGIGGIFKSLLGPAMSFIPGVGPLLGGLFGGFLAKGGNVSPGKSYVVGERRPELFTPSTSGRIIPSVPSEAPGAGTPQNHFNFSTHMEMVDTSGGDEFIDRHAQATADAVQKALRHRGIGV